MVRLRLNADQVANMSQQELLELRFANNMAAVTLVQAMLTAEQKGDGSAAKVGEAAENFLIAGQFGNELRNKSKKR